MFHNNRSISEFNESGFVMDYLTHQVIRKKSFSV